VKLRFFKKLKKPCVPRGKIKIMPFKMMYD